MKKVHQIIKKLIEFEKKFIKLGRRKRKKQKTKKEKRKKGTGKKGKGKRK